jgi:hypothetical protein
MGTRPELVPIRHVERKHPSWLQCRGNGPSCGRRPLLRLIVLTKTKKRERRYALDSRDLADLNSEVTIGP